MQKTKKIVGFVVEYYELDVYRFREKQIKIMCSGKEVSETEITYFVTPDCYKRTYKAKFNSAKKLNKALDLKKDKNYYFNQSLGQAIKGVHDIFYYNNDLEKENNRSSSREHRAVSNFPKGILLVRQLHNLGTVLYNV